MNQRTRVYELTEKGRREMEVITKANEQIQDLLKKVALLNTA
ncbi:MAG: hypothetical protein ACE5L6_07240 [Candidatus Bathyarchaeia archaeon]